MDILTEQPCILEEGLLLSGRNSAFGSVSKSVGGSLLKTALLVSFCAFFVFAANIIVVLWLLCSHDAMSPSSHKYKTAASAL